MRNKLEQLYKLARARTYRSISVFCTYLSESWNAAWQTVFDIGAWIVSLLFNKQLWFVILVMSIFWSLTKGPSILGNILDLERWEVTSCDFQEVQVFVNYPKLIAPGDQREFEITLQNKNNNPLTNVRLGITSPKGLLLFEEANFIFAEMLKPNEAITEKLPFRIAKYDDFKHIPIIIAYQVEDKLPQYCSNPPTLLRSKWRRTVVRLKAIPDALDIVATSIGYLGTLITGLLAIRGKIGPVVREIISVLRGVNKNNHNEVAQNDNST